MLCVLKQPMSLPHYHMVRACLKRAKLDRVHPIFHVGSEEALAILLRANAHHAFLFAISRFTRTDPLALRAAFSRALRALASSLADVVGPSLWGLKPESSLIKSEAREALEYLFQVCNQAAVMASF